MSSRFTESVVQNKPKFDFVAAHFDCETNRFSERNPEGFVNLGSAQNYLHAELLGDRLAFVEGQAGDVHYQPFTGTAECQQSIADYLQHQAGVSVAHDSIVVGNGIISILEALTIALLDEADSVLIPTPVFPGLVAAMNLRVRSHVELMETDPHNGFRLTPAAMEAYLHQSRWDGRRIRAILLCSPGNPVGQVFSPEELRGFLDVAEMFDCALIVDEVYAGSVFEGHEFTSAISLQSDNVYVLGGLSKDFGLAGHATGWLQSSNKDVMAAVAKQAHFFRLPTPVQRIVSAVLNPAWREDYLNAHCAKLTETARVATDQLREAGILAVDSEAGLCLWVDLTEYLSSKDAKGEMALYESLLNEHRVHISPGSGFKSSHLGYFRLCFSQPIDVLLEGMRRLISGLQVIGGLQANAAMPANTDSQEFTKSF